MSQRRRPLAAALRALAAGLAAFFVLESALARRVGPDLFLPAAAGAFLPGRTARLAACLVLGFALALTDRGRAVGRALDRFCARDRGRWALAAGVTALFFLWTLRVTVLSYMTMDEVYLLQHIAQVPEKGLAAVHNALAQTVTEKSSPFSVLLCLALGQLYRLDADGYWYLGFQLAVLLGSFTVIGRCILVKTSARRWPAWAGCAVYAALYAGALFYTASRIAFTVTAAAAGSAAVALVLCRHQESGRAGRVRCDILSGALMVLCCMLRRASGYCLLCFWALALAYQVLRVALAGRDGLKKRLGALALAAVVTLALIGGVFAAVPLESDEQYREAEYYRSLVGDYLRYTLTLDQYAEAGVSQELATMLHGWYYMDRSVTVDLFRELGEIYDAERTVPALPVQLWQAAPTLASTLWNEPAMRWQAALALALLILALAAAVRFGRRYGPELLCALGAAGGAALLMLYLTKDGRFPAQAFLTVSIPALVSLTLMGISAPEAEDSASPVRGAAGRGAAGLCLAAAALCCCMGMYVTPHAAQAVTHADVFALQAAADAFAAANSGKTIVSCIFDHLDINTDPLKRLSDYPANIVQWGYCGDLAKDPAERLYDDAFFRDDVLFMADSPSSAIGLLQYLSLKWGPVQAAVAERLPAGVMVYDISQVSPGGEDYTGWYEQNGMTYYFRDGEPLTGEQVVDGERCTFAPAGAQAQMAVSSEGGLVYTTDAYSLVTGP